jgi:hypothetical protein
MTKDPEAIKQEIFAAWKAEQPDGTLQQFDDHWVALTSEARSNATRAASAPTPNAYEGPDAIKRKLYEEWIAARPGGTREQFEAEWGMITASLPGG